MGKRKERRLAAMTAAGRRVKLDLFAEPSGDLVGSSAQEDDGGDDYSKDRAGSPNSPTSSGQPPENPLSLLGQYSDDDLDEESSKEVNHTEHSPTDFNDLAKVAADKEYDEIVSCARGSLEAQEVEHHNIKEVSDFPGECSQKLGENGSSEDDVADRHIPHANMAITEHFSVKGTSDVQSNADGGSGWKMVLHEESNQYYYWNTVTGETSWDVPAVLTQGAESTSEISGANDAEGTDNAVVGIHVSNLIPDNNLETAVPEKPSDGSNFADPNFIAKEIPELMPKMEVATEGYASGIFSTGFVSSSQPSDALVGNSGAADAELEKYIQDSRNHNEHEAESDLCSRLLKLGEFLLERLSTLKGSKGRLIGHDKISRYTAEVEIRLGDMKSLSSHGSSLFPFWLHCERQLKLLESAISDEVLQFYESVEMSDAEPIEKNVVCSTSENPHASPHVEVMEEVLKESHAEIVNNVVAAAAAVQNDHITPIECFSSHSDSNPGGKGEVHRGAVPDEVTAMVDVHSGEDVDMDVEMEVEDAVPSNQTSHDAPEPQPVWPNPHAEQEGVGITPPLDDNWIPPPPPDNEPFPPPPPDEPPESAYPPPPPDSVLAPSFSYTTQYNLSYPGSCLEYYGQPNMDVPGSSFYAHDPNQIAVPHTSYYYEAAPNSFTTTAPVVVNPVEPVSYYGLQDETVPPVPGVGSPESRLHPASGPGSLDSDHIRSESTTLPNAGVNAFIADGETGKESVEVSFSSFSDQAPPTISLTQGTSMPLAPAATVAATATVPKKVPRNKKRTTAVAPTLRSNKKVSSLVDKWKAAKEELHEEEEDEPENAYEILEKKRQREIEEWRAKQIASGEAKDNANFQPLGGDWRERVKRKRARSMNKSVDPSSDITTDGNQQPNLVELSKDLPSGWQAYWDESSKQVYYGNSVTSETTWIRPTN